MRRPTVDQGKIDKLHGKAFAKGGGRNRMFPEQAANRQKPGVTGHEVEGRAPGPKAARGGPPVRGVGGRSRPTQSGRTGT
jgi:hypothetical protein